MATKEAEVQDDVRPNRLREIRERGFPLTQKEMARLLGIDHTTVSRHENGRGLTAEHIARYTDIMKLAGSHEIFFEPGEFNGSGTSE